MKLYRYVENIKEEWFRVTMRGIEYYEDFFDTKYPFGKLDHVFVPDYCNGAMENVGCIIYTEGYVQRDEAFTQSKK